MHFNYLRLYILEVFKSILLLFLRNHIIFCYLRLAVKRASVCDFFLQRLFWSRFSHFILTGKILRFLLLFIQQISVVEKVHQILMPPYFFANWGQSFIAFPLKEQAIRQKLWVIKFKSLGCGVFKIDQHLWRLRIRPINWCVDGRDCQSCTYDDHQVTPSFFGYRIFQFVLEFIIPHQFHALH